MKQKLKSAFTSAILALILAALLLPVGIAAQDGNSKAKININTASAEELQALPRVGEKVAQRIVEYREANGKFKAIEDIMKVQGIGEKTFLQLKDLITVGEVPA
jgi:competence protein ComEA